jgi:hypothetical protein
MQPFSVNEWKCVVDGAGHRVPTVACRHEDGEFPDVTIFRRARRVRRPIAMHRWFHSVARGSRRLRFFGDDLVIAEVTET